VKDNLSLIAAAAGGFMLSVALAGILRGAPVTNLEQARINVYQAAQSEAVTVQKSKRGSYTNFKQNT
jgi:hypothetical protein